MKQYLKMADVFDMPLRDEAYRVDFAVISDSNDHMIGGFGIEGMSSHAANAINSHDELVQMNQDLLNALESIENDAGQVPKFMWDMIQATIAKAKGGAA